MHTCETCGNEWPENYCPRCGHTIGRASNLAAPPPLPPVIQTKTSTESRGGLFGLFKKRQPAASPQTSSSPTLPAGKSLWDEMGMCRLVPDYLQLHLASRSPQHTLSRRADGSIDTDDIPPLIQTDPQIRDRITQLVREQLPNDTAALMALTAEDIVSRLCRIYTQVTAKDMYGIVCRAWCVEHKLL